MNWFEGKDLVLQTAIDHDDAGAVAQAARAGANVNAKGLHGVTPLTYAVGHDALRTFRALLDLGADPNIRDAEGDNAMTLAAEAYRRKPEFLTLALRAGGDPNTRRADDDPLIIRFVNDADCMGIRMMQKAGADLNAKNRSGDPLVVYAGLVQSWDVVWCLLEAGARYDYGDDGFTLRHAFENRKATPPDSPLWPYKEKAWKFLRNRGVALPELTLAH